MHIYDKKKPTIAGKLLNKRDYIAKQIAEF